MLRKAIPFTALSPDGEADSEAELTLEAIMARMRQAAQRGVSTIPSIFNGDRDQSAAAFTVLELQAQFNQALLSAVSSIAQHLRQLRRAETPAASELVQRIEQLSAKVNDVARR